jgi:peroxiredoxin
MSGKQTVLLMMLALGGVMWLSACDRDNRTAGQGVPQPTSPVADSHAGHDHGEHAPAFTLPGADGKPHSLSDYEGKWVVLEWINHGCPFVKKFYDAGKMQELQKQYTDQGVVWLSVCSSAEGKQGYHTAAQWQQVNQDQGSHATTTLLDVDGKVGKAYGARTTPHMFVINPQGEIVYQGGIDDQPSADAATLTQANNYVVDALDAGLAGNAVPVDSAKPYGCGVKYAN